MKNKIKVALANKLYKFVMKYTTYFEEPKIQLNMRDHKVDMVSMTIRVSDDDLYSHWVRLEDVVRSKYSEVITYDLAKQLLKGQYIDFKHGHYQGDGVFTGTIKVVRRD